MKHPQPDSYWDRVRLCVRASEGDGDALRQVTRSVALNEMARQLRLWPALALSAERSSVEPDERWRQHLQATMTSWLVVERSASSVGEALSDMPSTWVAIKGFDVGTRFYAPREQRQTSDLDILVGASAFSDVRRTLEAAGWVGSQASSRWERYMRDEGYAWQAKGPGAALLEVHFRLWGVVPEGLAGEVLAESEAAPDLGPMARWPRPEYSFLLASVHGWTQAPPRSLNDWRDLERIGRSTMEGLAERIVHLARQWALQLPIALSAAVAERLWPNEVHARIARDLRADLRSPEERVLKRLITGGVESVSWPQVVLARLLAGRPGRAGWRAVGRRIWAHPGEVERTTPEALSWPRRRVRHLISSLGLD